MHVMPPTRCPRARGTWTTVLICASMLGAATVAAQEISVEETIAAARAGDWEVMETLAQAAAECGTDPDAWQRQLVAGIVNTPAAALNLDAFRNTVPAVAATSRDCREDLGVQEWVRAALDEDIPESFYREMLRGLDGVQLVGYLAIDELASDPGADPLHRLWATEVLVGADRSGRGPRIAGLPGRLAERYMASGLPPAYVEEWLPMLLAAVETREAAAQRLIGMVSLRPDMEGAAEIVRIVGANVEAYDHRFSAETRSRVRAALEVLARRPGVPPELAGTARETMTARSGGLNHLGVAVQFWPLDLEVSPRGDSCAVAWPATMASAVEAVAPGFLAAPRGGGCEAAVRSADFNGDGLQDALVRGTVNGATILMAVIAGPDASAHVLERMRVEDYGVVAPPGAFTPACDAVGTFVFPNDYVTISYDETSSSNFRFNGEEFEQLMGDWC